MCACAAPAAAPSQNDVFVQLRDLADPVIVTGAPQRIRGTAGAGVGVTDVGTDVIKKKDDRARAAAGRVSPFVNSNVGFITQAVVSGDGTKVRLSLNATFNGVTGVQRRPVNLSVLSGGRRP